MIGELTTHLWQSTFFAVAVGLLTAAFRKNRATVRYWLWFSASLKFFIPFALLMSLGGRLGWEPAVQRIATPAVSFVVERLAQPLPAAVSLTPVAKPQTTDWLPIIILGLWGGGFVAMAAMRFRGWLRVRRAVRSSMPMDIASAVDIRVSPGLLEPGVVGLLRPTLLLPEGIVDRLTPSQLETVLAHELCHVRRRDNIFAAIHMVVETICWFHPLVWWIGARLVEERERACDEEVLRLGGEPRTYADAILNVCRLYVESPLACVPGVTGSNIRKRIEAIMINRRVQGLNRTKKFLLACAGVVTLAGPVVIGVLIGVGHMPVIQAQSPAFAPPVLHMDQSLIQPVPSAKASSSATQAVPARADAPVAGPGPILYKDRRLMVMLFNMSTMTSDEQARVRQSGVNFVRDQIRATDLTSVMWADNGNVSVMQDFTDDPILLEAAIFKLSVGSGRSYVPTADRGFGTLQTVAKMLAPFPQRKALMYLSAGISQDGADQQALLNAVSALKSANIAIYPIDALAVQPAPAAITYTGHAEDLSVFAVMLSHLDFETRTTGAPILATMAGLPGAHATFQAYPAGQASQLSFPLDSLTDKVDILGQIMIRPDASGGAGKAVATVRDGVTVATPPGVYQMKFVLAAGSYVCRLIVREKATGRTYAESIDFEVK